ncbi:unnamed protein product, partial [Prorocentrum cordatum]
ALGAEQLAAGRLAFGRVSHPAALGHDWIAGVQFPRRGEAARRLAGLWTRG